MKGNKAIFVAKKIKVNNSFDAHTNPNDDSTMANNDSLNESLNLPPIHRPPKTTRVFKKRAFSNDKTKNLSPNKLPKKTVQFDFCTSIKSLNSDSIMENENASQPFSVAFSDLSGNQISFLDEMGQPKNKKINFVGESHKVQSVQNEEKFKEKGLLPLRLKLQKEALELIEDSRSSRITQNLRKRNDKKLRKGLSADPLLNKKPKFEDTYEVIYDENHKMLRSFDKDRYRVLFQTRKGAQSYHNEFFYSEIQNKPTKLLPIIQNSIKPKRSKKIRIGRAAVPFNFQKLLSDCEKTYDESFNQIKSKYLVGNSIIFTDIQKNNFYHRIDNFKESSIN